MWVVHWMRASPRVALLWASAAALAGCPQSVPPAAEFASQGRSGASDGARIDDASGVGGNPGSDAALAEGAESGADGEPKDAAPGDVGQGVADSATIDGASQDGGPAGDGGLPEGVGAPCTINQECAPWDHTCWKWSCENGGCLAEYKLGGYCDDGDPCTETGLCSKGGCQKGVEKCDDGSPCTVDSCIAGGTCQYAAAADGGGCEGDKVCKSGGCVSGIGTSVIAVAAAKDSTCAVIQGGKAFCWGQNVHYQVGAGGSAASIFEEPTPVNLPVGALDIACGGDHCCAVAQNGLYCWGNDSYGQSSGLGAGREKPGLVVKVPTKVAVAAVGVALGYYHTCALDAGGVVRCFGLGIGGQLGDGSSQVGSKPVVVALPQPAQVLRCGHFHCCAIVSGVPYCWGDNGYGQLGLSTSVKTLTPQAAKGVQGAVALALGFGHTCAVLEAGSVMCWGENSGGQAGTKGTNVYTPTLVAGLTGVTVLGAGAVHTCAVAGGKLVCFGYNTYAQSAPGSNSTLIATPTAVAGLPPGAQVVGIALGAAHSCVRTSAAGLFCWGANGYGQIGNGTHKDQPTPWQVQ